ncbi:hypothetical protein DSC47_11130 [Elizabethkingia miricola]|uniref:hypothetical protein n=1 Tax=Elizabethkingia bruuniana TaxID=1756149 RepID=UPI000999B4DA|nr:hypothetical protein [Elizabethkingia bruuniana]OPC55095.1 hypothetical protein BAY07_19705 [Elizabethkingia bruuniana]OPC62486.1 hypothetical protein BAY13_06605 [Elizabethkingia bruuniana]RBI91826.1 hypothetical protein DSC47_11130 [Elizabethkingia miricola]
MKLYSEDIIILKELYISKIVQFYGLHLTHSLSPAQILRCTDKFSKLGIFELDNENISLSEKGKKWIEANKKFIFLKKFQFNNRFDKSKYIIERIEVNSLYKPVIKSIDRRIFKEGE